MLVAPFLCLHSPCPIAHTSHPLQSDHQLTPSLSYLYLSYDKQMVCFLIHITTQALCVPCVFISGSLSPLSKFPCIGNWKRRKILPMGWGSFTSGGFERRNKFLIWILLLEQPFWLADSPFCSCVFVCLCVWVYLYLCKLTVTHATPLTTGVPTHLHPALSDYRKPV